jgi:hypothetical protein
VAAPPGALAPFEAGCVGVERKGKARSNHIANISGKTLRPIIVVEQVGRKSNQNLSRSRTAEAYLRDIAVRPSHRGPRTRQNNRTWQRDRYQATWPVGVASQDHLYAVPGKQPCYYGFTPAMAKFEIPARARPSGYLDRA